MLCFQQYGLKVNKNSLSSVQHSVKYLELLLHYSYFIFLLFYFFSFIKFLIFLPIKHSLIGNQRSYDWNQHILSVNNDLEKLFFTNRGTGTNFNTTQEGLITSLETTFSFPYFLHKIWLKIILYLTFPLKKLTFLRIFLEHHIITYFVPHKYSYSALNNFQNTRLQARK